MFTVDNIGESTVFAGCCTWLLFGDKIIGVLNSTFAVLSMLSSDDFFSSLFGIGVVIIFWFLESVDDDFVDKCFDISDVELLLDVDSFDKIRLSGSFK